MEHPLGCSPLKLFKENIMQTLNTPTKSKPSCNQSSRNKKRRLLTLLNSEWDAQYNPVPLVTVRQGWNNDYPDLERLFH